MWQIPFSCSYLRFGPASMLHGLLRSRSCLRHFSDASATTSGAVEKRVLFLGSVWPQPSVSAAGVRTTSLIEGMHQSGTWYLLHQRSADISGWEIHFFSSAKQSTPTDDLVSRFRARVHTVRTSSPVSLSQLLHLIPCPCRSAVSFPAIHT